MNIRMSDACSTLNLFLLVKMMHRRIRCSEALVWQVFTGIKLRNLDGTILKVVSLTHFLE